MAVRREPVGNPGRLQRLLRRCDVRNLATKRSQWFAIAVERGHWVSALVGELPAERLRRLEHPVVDRLLPDVVERDLELVKVVESGHVSRATGDLQGTDRALHIGRRRPRRNQSLLRRDDRRHQPADELRQILRR